MDLNCGKSNHEDALQGHHLYKRVWSPPEVLQHNIYTLEERNNCDHFVVLLLASSIFALPFVVQLLKTTNWIIACVVI